MNKIIDLTKISTEQRNERTKFIDRSSIEESLSMINYEDSLVHQAVATQIPSIGKAVEAGINAIENGGRLVYIGAGTSGRLGVLDASEMPPTFNVPNNLIIGIIAGGDFALRNPIEGAEDSEEEVIKDLKEIDFNEKDVLVGIAASGRTPYVISGINYAKSLGATTVSLSTTNESEIGKIADIKIEPVTGEEAITGSTRMKSGTAQKLVLNMLSSTIMIKLGKVYENLMIDVKPANAKLKERAIKIVSELVNNEREEIIEALEASDYSPKIAIAMLLKGMSANEAKDILSTKKLNEVI